MKHWIIHPAGQAISRAPNPKRAPDLCAAARATVGITRFLRSRSKSHMKRHGGIDLVADARDDRSRNLLIHLEQGQ
jgi:hypothetical protein